MKTISRIITILMAAAFFMTGLPAVEAFAAEETGSIISGQSEQDALGQPEQSAPGQEQLVIPEEQGQTGLEQPAQNDLDGEAANGIAEQPVQIPAEEAPAMEPETEEIDPAAPAEELMPAEESTEETGHPALLEEASPEENAAEQAPKKGMLNLQKLSASNDKETLKKAGDKDEDEIKPGKTALSITNNTKMFKVVDAYIETKKDGSMELVIALSGTGYQNLFVGTYEEAVKVGYDPSKWIKYFTDTNGNYAFRIPIDRKTDFLPIIVISQTYLEKYLDKKNSLSRAFYARQIELNQKKKTLISGDYERTVELKVKNNTKNLTVDLAELSYFGGPNNNSFAADLIAKLKDIKYDSAFIGTKEDAAEAEKTIAIGKNQVLTLPIKWLAKFGDPDSLVSLAGKTFTLSLYSSETKTWTEFSFTVNEKTKTLTIDVKDKKDTSSTDLIVIPGQKSSKEKQKKQKQQEQKNQKAQDSLGGGTAAVDNSTALKDGVYTPDKFSYSGGSGKIAITCSQVEVKDGKAYATIEFRNLKSGSSEFSYVKANGQQYNCSQVGGVSVATIPVELNANTSLLAMTTKMSAAHEIAYTIFVYIKGADEKGADDLTKNKEFDKEAPQIAGLEATGEETVEEAQNFKVFNYSDGIRLLEINMRSDSDKEKKESTEEKKETEEDAAEETIIDEETGEEIIVKTDKSAAQAKLYKGNIIKYLLVPEGVEIPAGLDKETIVVPLPVKKVYAGSEQIRKLIEQLGAGKQIACMEKEDGNIQGAGSFENLKLRTLVKEKCDAVIVPGEALETEKGRETFEAQAEDLANLDIMLIADRSSSEKTKKAKAEWIKVYGILLGCEQAANEAYQAIN